MINTLINILLFNTLNCFIYEVLMTTVTQAHHFSCSQGFEIALDDAEDHLNRIVIWLVCYIVDVSEAQPLHLVR